MKQYKLKLTALTPIHIGTGEVYEPTNFVIDNGYLYEFDEFKFYRKLPENDKKTFVNLTEKKGYESLFELHKFIKSRKEFAKQAYTHKVQVTKSIQKDYDNKIGRVVQKEGGKRINIRKVFNKFEIERTIRLNNDAKKVYIPGSSLKGSISTAIQESIYKSNPKLYYKLFENSLPNENFMKELAIADTMPLKTYSIIGYAVNRERFEDDNLGPHILIETIYSSPKQQSQFETTLTLKDEFCTLPYTIDIKDIQKACNEHYLPIFEQQFKASAVFKGRKVDEWTNEYFSDEFYDKYKDFKLKDNQFLIRVGKYSQARAVTIEGMRKVRVKISGGGPKRKPNKWETLDQETTTWMFGFSDKANIGLMPFGWVLCEVIEVKQDKKKIYNVNRLKNVKKDETKEKNNQEEKSCDEKLNEFRINNKFERNIQDCFFKYIKDKEYKAKEQNETDELEEDSNLEPILFNTLQYINEIFNDPKLNNFFNILKTTLPTPKVKSISFNNFKAFGVHPQKFKIKPITLVYAPNSVGKSSLQHAMVHLQYFAIKHFEMDKISLDKTKMFGDEIDIGGFKNYIHKHDTNREIEYVINIDDYRLPYLKGLNLTDKDIKVKFWFYNLIQQFNQQNNILHEILKFFIKVIKEEYNYFKYKNNFDENIRLLSKLFNENTNEEDAENEFLMKLKKIILKLVHKSNESIEELIITIKKSYLTNLEIFENPQILIIKYYIKNNEHKSIYCIGNKEFLIYHSMMSKEEIEDKIAIAKEFDKIVISKPIQYIGPLRYYPDRNFILQDINEKKSYSSDQLWSLLKNRNTLRKDINNWLTNKDKLKSHYKIIANKNSENIKFLDKRTNTEVTHKDIGLGVSQVLPVLIASYFDRGKTISIEQPELHLHPAVQAELGDEIIKSYKNWSNYFFIETHSEYLLLRIMRRMRYTANQKEDRDKNLDITPDDVSVLYIDTNGDKTYILEIELNKEGKLLDRWPGGFFEEGFKERFL